VPVEVTRRKRQRERHGQSGGERRKVAAHQVTHAPSERRTATGSGVPPGARWVRTTLIALSVLYLASVWLDGVGSRGPERVLPRPLLYFVQAAQLFTRAGTFAIDYRAELWSCDEQRWRELDTRPYFRINRDDKENRFHRALHFHRRKRVTMQALERYLIESHERSRGGEGAAPGARIGGVRFLSLRTPIPEPGQPVARHRRKPLAEHPEENQRRWYQTPRLERAARCGGTARPSEDDA
jgi:hypothetical protein